MNENTEPAVEPSTSKHLATCRHCKQELAPGACKCHHCGSFQNWWRWLGYAPIAISFIIMLVAISQILLARTQFGEAKKERISAGDALQKAEQAQKTVTEAMREVQAVSSNAIDKLEEIEKTRKRVLAIETQLQRMQPLPHCL